MGLKFVCLCSGRPIDVTGNNKNNINELAQQIEEKLFLQHGPIMTGDILFKSLGYASADAFRQAVSRNTVPIYVFSIVQRRGKFALTSDVAKWIAMQRFNDKTK